MLKLFRSALLGTALAFAALPAAAQALTAKQKTEIESLIRDYLLKNPELIQESLVELERRQKDAEQNARLQVIKDPNGPLLASKYNFVVGNPKGDVTIVEFFDYNCGFCKRGLADMQRLVKEDPKLRIIAKDFPILSPGSREAAAVALAVKQQVKPEKFWDFHVKLMNVRGPVGKTQAIDVAKEIGADLGRVLQDMEKPEVTAAIEETRGLADSLGLTGTPSYIVGDEVVVGAVGYDKLKQRIDSLRKCGKSEC